MARECPWNAILHQSVLVTSIGRSLLERFEPRGHTVSQLRLDWKLSSNLVRQGGQKVVVA